MSITKSTGRATILRSKSAVSATTKQLIGPVVDCAQQNDAGHTVKVNQSNGKVDSIEVTCACGERILVRCDYE